MQCSSKHDERIHTLHADKLRLSPSFYIKYSNEPSQGGMRHEHVFDGADPSTVASIGVWMLYLRETRNTLFMQIVDKAKVSHRHGAVFAGMLDKSTRSYIVPCMQPIPLCHVFSQDRQHKLHQA